MRTSEAGTTLSLFNVDLWNCVAVDLRKICSSFKLLYCTIYSDNTGWTSGVRFPAGQNFFFATKARLTLGPNQPSVRWVLSSEVNRPGLEADHLPPSAEIKNVYGVYLHSPCVCMAWCVIKYQRQLYRYSFLLSSRYVLNRLNEIASYNHNTTLQPVLHH